MAKASGAHEGASAPPLDPDVEKGDGGVGRRASSSGDFTLPAVRRLPQVDGGDWSLYRDLLFKARGDHALAKKWMADIGAHAPIAPVPDEGGGVPEDLDLAASEAGAPGTFFCPISFKVFRDPVQLPTGQTYERRYIQRWLESNSTCPITGQHLRRPVALVPNVALRKSIEEWAERNAAWMLGVDGHVRAIASEEDFADVRPHPDADVALAMLLQEQELAHAHAPQRAPLPAPRRSGRKPGWAGAGLYAITAGVVATYVLALWRNGWQIEALHDNPLLGPSSASLLALGAKSTPLILDQGQYWRLLTAMFLCPGMVDLFCVVMTLWTVGRHLERALGAPWLSVPGVYLVAGCAASLASANLAVTLVSCTASGAVCGLVGAAWADQIAGWRRYGAHGATLGVLALLTAALLLLGFLPLLDNFASLAGLVSGALTTCLALGPGRARRSQRLAWRAWQAVCLATIVAGMGVGVAGLITGAVVGKQCSWCPGFACVPLQQRWACGAGPPPALHSRPSCTFAPQHNGTATVTCPSGFVQTVAAPASGAGVSNDALMQICNSVCTHMGLVPAPLAAPSRSPTNAPALGSNDLLI